MGNVDIIKDSQILLNALFDIKEVYKYLYDWLNYYGYDVTETHYKEKVKPEGKELEIRWEADRDIDEYSRFTIKVKWLILGMVDVEVQQAGGEKIKMQKGELNMYISAKITTDRQKKWEASAFLKFLKSFYESYLYHDTLDELKVRLWKEGWEFINEAKAYLSLYKYM